MTWAALLAAEQWLRRTGISHPDISALLDHAWRWSTINPETFDAWYAELPRLRVIATIPPDIAAVSARAGVPPSDLADLIHALDDLVYGNLFGGLQFEYLEADLDRVADVAERYELGLPPPDRLPPSSRREGWGRDLDHDAVLSIRGVDWTAPLDLTVE